MNRYLSLGVHCQPSETAPSREWNSWHSANKLPVKATYEPDAWCKMVLGGVGAEFKRQIRIVN